VLEEEGTMAVMPMLPEPGVTAPLTEDTERDRRWEIGQLGSVTAAILAVSKN
jgi:hypothetical protein